MSQALDFGRHHIGTPRGFWTATVALPAMLNSLPSLASGGLSCAEYLLVCVLQYPAGPPRTRALHCDSATNCGAVKEPTNAGYSVISDASQTLHAGALCTRAPRASRPSSPGQHGCLVRSREIKLHPGPVVSAMQLQTWFPVFLRQSVVHQVPALLFPACPSQLQKELFWRC